MRDFDDFADMVMDEDDHRGDASDRAAARSIESCLRYLQRQAETAGMPFTAHLISAAALSALEENLATRSRMTN